ncbi:hypothetical protein DDB_G0289871 [Dictyostelium discoideum AX4]|uniref:Uncharacterized protein n=1 Tax=Dictyostelium discoideum TaxID=44689 RepID=Q54GX0_DICDI|nr:hypothetical protein DDB_G0289871 [Dictyostelium discoideum AX4]EAL62536.1 hypothetical protein DDB_G0289871 [Dictyostelium discoideum AX4]|eukprot:XP_636037.1 hypothetical protein DDB_G0289871 [Dictyostelium discoideum AX4]
MKFFSFLSIGRATNVQSVMNTLTNENNKSFDLKSIDSFSLVDLSNQFISIKERIKFSKKELGDLLLFNKNVDGIIVAKNISLEKFDNIRNMFDDIPKVMLINGFVIITDLSVSKIHAFGLSYFLVQVGAYSLTSNYSLVGLNELSIAIPGNGFVQPDSCLLPKGRAQPNVDIPTVAFEMYYSKGVSYAVARARILFRISGIQYVLCICIRPRDPNNNNTFKCTALVFNGVISRENPVSIISFGTKPISQINENQYQTITVGVPAVGYKRTNPVQCNAPNLPMFLISIPSTIIFNGVPNPPANIPPALNLDLFILQSSFLEYVEDFTGNLHHQ